MKERKRQRESGCDQEEDDEPDIQNNTRTPHIDALAVEDGRGKEFRRGVVGRTAERGKRFGSVRHAFGETEINEFERGVVG